MFPSKKWLEISACRSLTSERPGFNGLEFNVCSTIHIVVERTSFVTDLFPKTAYRNFLQLLTNCSHTSPKWGAAGVLNFHQMLCGIRCSSVPPLFHAATCSANSRSAPKILSRCRWLPLRAINRMIALRQLSVVNLGTTSMCTVLTVTHVNKQHHRFSFLRPVFTVNGPKKSNSTFVKAVEASNRSSGRSAIIVCALPFLHLILIDRKAFRKPRIHIFCWTMFLTRSVPSCCLFLWSFCKNNSTAWCFQCSNIGCFALKSKWLLPILLLTRLSPSSSWKGKICRILLLFGVSFSTLRFYLLSKLFSLY